jgi:uridine kinase
MTDQPEADEAPHQGAQRRRIVVLAGPSGSGKTRLAARLHTEHGWPVVRLDDFYRDLDDPALPREQHLGIVDWDHPGSWNASAAVSALVELVDTGRMTAPVYDIMTSRPVGSHEVSAGPDDLVIAEGIFAADIIPALRDAGVLHAAWCIHHRPSVTFVRRLARDLAERRKPPTVLVRRGLSLMRAEPAIVERLSALGAVRARPDEVEAMLRTGGVSVR